jgi:mannose-6-phosphate isomerase-like protein (cupin superfamily)
MSEPFTHLNLDDVKGGPGRENGSRRRAHHRHSQAEEIYVVLAGDGFVKVGDEVRPVRVLDAKVSAVGRVPAVLQ